MAGNSTHGLLASCAGTRAISLAYNASLLQRDHPRDCLGTQHKCLTESPVERLALSAISKTTSPAASTEEEMAQHERERNQLRHAHIATVTVGSTTFGYQRALLNRLHTSQSAHDVVFNTASHKPAFTFVHDALMFPGTLANLLGKASSEDLIPTMTPALLPGFHAHIDIKTLQPMLVVSQQSANNVQGMVIFGLAKEARDIIREYYGRFSHRRKALVEIDVCIKTAAENETSLDDLRHIERRTVRAYVWSSKSLANCELTAKRHECPDWRLEDYLEGRLTPRNHLRVDPGGRGDEAGDGYIGRDIVDYGSEPEEQGRDVVYNGASRLDHLRALYNTG